MHDPNIFHVCMGEDGTAKVSVFLRNLKKKSIYYARFRVDRQDLSNGQRYITESLKTDNLDRALQLAQERYAQIRFAQQAGIGLKPLPTDEAINKFLSNYERNVSLMVAGFSPHMLRGFRRSLPYWTKYLGKKDINAVNVRQLEQYEEWRRAYAADPTNQTHGNAKVDPTRRTLQWEIGCFKQCLRWLKEHNHYNGNAYLYTYKVGKKERRSSFTIDQYRKLFRFMRSNEYVQVGKHKNDSRLHRYRQMLRTYVLFMVNTGLRVGEARHLRWEDIEERKNKLGQKVIVCRVSASHSKVKKSRQVVGRSTALNVLTRWREYLNKIGEDTSPSKRIFCTEKGDAIEHFREGFNNLIRAADVEFDREGKNTLSTHFGTRTSRSG